MRAQQFYHFTFLFAFFLLSCDSCNHLDCITDNYSGQFRIISKIDDSDLVFGPHSKYDPAEIKFYSIQGVDTTFFEYDPIKFPGSGYDSILYVRFSPKTTTTLFMQLDNLDIDTLALTHKTFKTKCCGTITEIINFRYNQNTDIPGNQGTQEIRK